MENHTSQSYRENEQLRADYLAGVSALNGDAAGRHAAWRHMMESPCRFQGGPVPISFLPLLLGPTSRSSLQKKAETVYRILEKVIQHYRNDPDYRREFRYDPRMRELIDLPVYHDAAVPCARVDCMYDETTDEAFFCEFNTDASSGMLENRSALEAIASSQSYARFVASHPVHDEVSLHFDGWVQTFLTMRETALARLAQIHGEVATDSPHLGIVVCFDSPDPDLAEVGAYAQLFEEAGLPCSVFDVRELTYDGHRLIGKRALVGQSDVALDSIWRFTVAVDLLTHWDDVQGFLEGIRAGAAVLIGGFITQIAHDKQIFAVLHHPATLQLLNAEEREFVRASIPRTAFLDDPDLDLELVRNTPERWMLKPTDWYESINVTSGRECTPEQWNDLIDAALADDGPSGWLIQEFHAPHRIPAIPLYGEDSDPQPTEMGAIYGLYLFDGVFSGVYLRQGPHNVIGSARQGLAVPVLIADE